MSLEIIDRVCPFCFQQDKNSYLEVSSKVEYSTLTESEVRTIWNNVFNRKFFFHTLDVNVEVCITKSIFQ